MPIGLIDLGLNMAQMMAAIFTNLIFENVRNATANSMVKSQLIHAEHFRQILLTDTNEIKEKINSLSQSRLLAAYDYVKRGLIVLQGLVPSSASTDMIGYYDMNKSKLDNLIQDAKRFFHQADIWATEAFHDKSNVPITMRLEAVRIQLFCTMLLHWDKPQQWLEMWRGILTNMIRDRGISQTVLTFNPWLSSGRKQEIRLTLTSVMSETCSALWKIAHDNVALAEAAADTLKFVKSPIIMDEKYYPNWQKAIGVNQSMFLPWNGHLVVFIPECCRMCVLPENRLCIIDRKFKLTIVDAVTLKLIGFSKSSPFDSKKEYSSLGFDKSKNLLLVVQFEPNLLLTYDYSHSDDIKLNQQIQLPEQGYSIFSTASGHWIFRGWSGKIYASWNGSGQWTKLCDNVSIIFDVQDTMENDISGAQVLTDICIESFYQDSQAGQSSCVISTNRQELKLASIFENRDWIQSILSFDHENLIVAHKIEKSNEIRLSYIYRNDANEFSSVNVSNVLPIKFEETLELLLVNKNAIYIGTRKKLELSLSNSIAVS